MLAPTLVASLPYGDGGSAGTESGLLVASEAEGWHKGLRGSANQLEGRAGLLIVPADARECLLVLGVCAVGSVAAASGSKTSNLSSDASVTSFCASTIGKSETRPCRHRATSYASCQGSPIGHVLSSSDGVLRCVLPGW